MVTFFAIIATALLLDVVFNDGSAFVSIIKSFRKQVKIEKTEVELICENISELNEELTMLEDELSDAISEEEVQIELSIRNKMKLKKEILSTYLKRLDSLGTKA